MQSINFFKLVKKNVLKDIMKEEVAVDKIMKIRK